MANCRVESVVAENGKPSRLYEDLLRITADQSRALELYLELSDTAFPANETDKNGEPVMDAIVDTGLLNDVEIIRYQKGPEGYNQESIENDVIDAMITQIDYGIQELEKILNSSRDEGERAKIQNQIEELKNDKRKVAGRETVSAVREAANRQLEWAKELSDKDQVSVEEIMQAIKMMDMWKPENTLQFLNSRQIKNEEQPFTKLFNEVGGRAEAIQNSLVRRGLDRIVDQVNEYGDGYVDIEDVSELDQFEEISGTKQWLFNISHVSDDLIGHFHRTLMNAKTDQGNAITDLQQRLNELEEDVSDSSVLLREDENGNKTAELISPFSKEYYKARNGALESYYNSIEASEEQDPERASETLKNAKKKLYGDLNEIENLIDIRYLSEDFDTELSESEYRQNLVDKYGKDRAEYAIERAKKAYANYKSRKLDYREYLLSEVEANTHDTQEGESDSDWIDRKMREFEENNNPAMYIQDRSDPSTLDYPSSTGWEFTFSLPKAGEGHFDEAFENLTDSERALWDEITGTIQESLSYLPRDVRRGMDKTFLPKVRKSIMEEFQDRGMMEAANMWMSNFMNQITDAEDQSLIEEEGQQVPNPFETPGGTPPIRYIGSGDTDHGELSMDPIKATQMFYAMAVNYKKMTDVSAEAKLIHRIVEEGNTVRDDGQISEGAPRKLKDSIEEELEFLIAGNKRDAGKSSKWIDFVSEESMNPTEWTRIHRKKKELENQRDELKQQLREGKISQSEHDERLKELDQEYKDLGGRSLVWSSLVDNTLLSFGQMKGMAINVGAAFRNLMFGFVANFIHAAGGRDFTDSNVVSGLNILFRDVATRNGKVRALIDRFDILYDTAEVRYGKDRNVTGGTDLYFLQNNTEHMAQGLTMISKMLNTEIEDANGETRNLWEAFDDKGRWRTDEFGERPEWQPSLEREGGRKFTNFQSEVDQLNKRLHGDYSQHSKQKVKKYMWGRMVSMFRTWIPEVFAYRFGGYRKDPHLGREVVGSYRGTVSAFKDNFMGSAAKMLHSIAPFTGQNMEVEGVEQIDEEAIARAGREMQIWLALAAMAMLAKPGEDEEDHAARKIMANNLIMLQQDVGLYMSPTRMIDLMKNPMPATRAIIDFDRAMKGTYDYLKEGDNYQGKHPIWRWSSTMPVISQANSVRWQSERILPE